MPEPSTTAATASAPNTPAQSGLLSVQERWAPNTRCFGCGPKNEQGLRIRSFAQHSTDRDRDELVASWQPQPHHQAFDGVLNGGICGALLDCHSNWAAALHLQALQGADAPPCTVTAEFYVKLRRPTPTDGPIELRAWVVSSTETTATVEAELWAKGKCTATCRGIFASVTEGHPAFHRW